MDKVLYSRLRGFWKKFKAELEYIDVDSPSVSESMPPASRDESRRSPSDKSPKRSASPAPSPFAGELKSYRADLQSSSRKFLAEFDAGSAAFSAEKYGDAERREDGSSPSWDATVPPMDKVTIERDKPLAHAAYGQAITEIKRVLRADFDPERASGPLGEVSRSLSGLLESDNQALLVLTARSTAENYLYAHSVNVAILSLRLALAMGFEKDALVSLGDVALLHDIRMLKDPDIALRPKELTIEEYREMRRHSAGRQGFLGHIRDIEEGMRPLLAEILNQGLPKGLRRAEDIRLCAQIIGLCDVYEALSHTRPWRKRLLPREAMGTLIKQLREDVDGRLLKVFIERLSLYPPGSFVELSSGEIGRTVGLHPHLPTRPVLEIWLESDGGKRELPTLLNLAEKPTIHIVGPVDETELKHADKELLFRFKANRWWNE